MNLDHVFARTTVVLNDFGFPLTVTMGTHWLADDPLVVARPELFTTDCRFGLSWTGDPPPILALPPGEEDPVMTAKVRARSQAAR